MSGLQGDHSFPGMQNGPMRTTLVNVNPQQYDGPLAASWTPEGTSIVYGDPRGTGVTSELTGPTTNPDDEMDGTINAGFPQMPIALGMFKEKGFYIQEGMPVVTSRSTQQMGPGERLYMTVPLFFMNQMLRKKHAALWAQKKTRPGSDRQLNALCDFLAEHGELPLHTFHRYKTQYPTLLAAAQTGNRSKTGLHFVNGDKGDMFDIVRRVYDIAVSPMYACLTMLGISQNWMPGGIGGISNIKGVPTNPEQTIAADHVSVEGVTVSKYCRNVLALWGGSAECPATTRLYLVLRRAQGSVLPGQEGAAHFEFAPVCHEKVDYVSTSELYFQDHGGAPMQGIAYLIGTVLRPAAEEIGDKRNMERAIGRVSCQPKESMESAVQLDRIDIRVGG